MKTISIRNATIINEGNSFEGHGFLWEGEIWNTDALGRNRIGDLTINAKEACLTPGVINNQVYFWEPGLIHKGEPMNEFRAAVARGVTSYRELAHCGALCYHGGVA